MPKQVIVQKIKGGTTKQGGYVVTLALPLRGKPGVAIVRTLIGRN